MSRSEKMKGNKNGSGNKGRKFSPETLLKMSMAHKGQISPRRGKKLSIATRELLSRRTIEFHKKNNPKYIPYSYDDRKKIRRERIKAYGGCHSTGEWGNLKAQYNWKCPSCNKREPEIKLTRDHVIPISKGGSDNIENIQPLCVSCNSKKSTLSIKY